MKAKWRAKLKSHPLVPSGPRWEGVLKFDLHLALLELALWMDRQGWWSVTSDSGRAGKGKMGHSMFPASKLTAQKMSSLML